MLCSDPECAVRSLWKAKIQGRYEGLLCPQCNGPLKVDPAVAHNDEAFALLDEVLLYLNTVPSTQREDLRQRIAKHLGGNR